MTQNVNYYIKNYTYKVKLKNHPATNQTQMEISATTYENRVNTIISLEAPSESRCGNYDVQANPSVGRSNFNERARFSRAIVGRNSIGGSYDMAKTEHETISWNNDAEADVGTQHIQVPKVFAQITTPNKKIKNNLLSIPDVNINGDFTDFGGFDAVLRSNQEDKERANYLEYLSKNSGQYKQFGTQEDNTIPINFSKTEIWGNGGNDIYKTLPADSGNNNVIKDFQKGSKIKISTGIIAKNEIENGGLKYGDWIGRYSDSFLKIEGNIAESELKADLDRFKNPDTRKDAVIFISK